MTKLTQAIRLHEAAARQLARTRTAKDRMDAMRALREAFDMLVSAVADSEHWTPQEEQAFADFTARWEQ